MKPNIPKQFKYVGSWYDENPKQKWFEHYTKKKHKGKVVKKNKEGK